MNPGILSQLVDLHRITMSTSWTRICALFLGAKQALYGRAGPESGISKGYINLVELTGRLFKPDIFSATGLVYNTGDLGRMRSDGDIEHLGRIDDQVKVKGFRAELDGITAVICSSPSVSVATTLLVGQEIVSILAPDTANLDEVRSNMQASLPYYANPKQYIVLPSLPLTLNGKVDKARIRKLVTRGDGDDTTPIVMQFIAASVLALATLVIAAPLDNESDAMTAREVAQGDWIILPVSRSRVAASGIAHGAAHAFGGVVNGAAQAATGAAHGAAHAFDGVVNGAAQATTGMADGAAHAFDGAVRGAAQAATSAADGAAQAFGGVVDGAAQAATGMADGAAEAFDGVVNGAAQVATGVSDGTAHAFDGAVNGAAGFAAGMADGTAPAARGFM
ncbi:hypothetical protein PC9H_005564 [Pleurotus ostreatus]|uniref:AMP-binding enzyme C-terminal domain-containing protein n=1 Tax=Pleurotus ostreatus TaxID=5322 RepID=A0A8H7A0P6_PLEOS|nr:uncharacterized protein PC9H_005564 [Pleurotus ostreatus]KAF7433603.1 hypothetical protein PC9H_005564 [Pleurotus ostreatus]